MLSSRAHQITLDAPYYPTKTPSRGFKRTENAGARTIGPKGKALLLQTPFGDSKTQGLMGGFATTGKPRPFLDKTPFPNRVQQQKQQGGKDGLGKFPKLETEQHATPETLRPSSTRKHVRLPRISGGNFQTPVNRGNHWDVGDISLELAEPQVQETISEDDHDEIEFMAPNTLDLPYQPPFDFDLPDYKSVGRDFRKAIFSPAFDDVEPQLADLDEIKPLPESWSFMPLKDIDDDDDDPFRRPEPKATVFPKAVPAPGKRTLASQIRRPASAIPPASTATSTSKAKITRPATSLATKPPAVAAPRRAVCKPVVTLPMRSFSTAAIKTSSSARATSSTLATAQRPGSRSVIPKTSTQSKAKPAAVKSYPDLLIFANEVVEDDFFFDV